MSGAVLLAQDASDVWSAWTSPGSSAGEVVLVIGAVCLMVVVIFIWAAFVRKPRRRRVHSYHHNHEASPEGGGLPHRHKRRSALSRVLGKRRHRHRSHGHERPVNPTLAQVGGLPPTRREPPPGS